MSLSFFAIYTNTQAVTQASLRETSAGATRTWSPDISRVCEARKDLSERNESHTCLLADPVGEHAKAGEEFHTQPKVLKVYCKYIFATCKCLHRFIPRHQYGIVFNTVFNYSFISFISC